jgi:bifunctional UDP-N-acetylglucosamine pyrophosphorylase/glucosamine-1-phosphate N-acetyltransferase
MLSVIILAAGQSKRMNSKLPKVLHSLGGLPMIHHVIKATKKLGAFQTILVTSPALHTHPSFASYTTVVQIEPKGTGHAVQTALTALDSKIEEVIILCGDTPLIHSETLHNLMDSKADLALIAMKLSTTNHAYGLIVQDKDGNPCQIVEFKDATSEQRKIPFGNAGIYKIKVSLLRELLPKLCNNNASEEYYLTDLVVLAYQQGYKTEMLEGNEEEFQGINNRIELAQAEAVLQNRWRLEMMQAGVTLIQPETIFLSHDTKIGKDSCVGPFVTFGPGVQLAEDVTILPFCHLEHTTIEEEASVGPFAHLRGNTVLQAGSSIGNFVEIKGSKIGKKAKAKHLSYIGDAEIGDKTNIGAGTITCNYDGFIKSKTIIEADVMIGANTSLIAPVTVGEGAIVAAGSTISESIPANALAIARSQQTTKPNWAKVFREKKKKT